MSVYADALEAAPKHVVALRNRAALLRDLGRDADALEGFERVIDVTPDDTGALGHAGFAALKLCAWDKAERFAPEIFRRVEVGQVVSPFVLLNLTDAPRLHAIGAANYAKSEIAATPAGPLAAAGTSGTDGLIRIAYLSARFSRPSGRLPHRRADRTA